MEAKFGELLDDKRTILLPGVLRRRQADLADDLAWTRYGVRAHKVEPIWLPVPGV